MMAVYLIVNLLADFLIEDLLQGGIWIWAALVWTPFRRKESGSDAVQAAPPPAPPRKY